MKAVLKTSGKKQGILQIDPRTKVFILIIGNLSVFFTSSLKHEIILLCTILVFGIMCGAYEFTLKMAVAYGAVVAVQMIGATYFTGVFRIMVISFCVVIRKIFPCGMLGGILIATTRVNEFMAGMNRVHMPKNIVIPLTVMLRYFPMIGEDWRYIKDAMRMRDVSPSFRSLMVNPVLTVECVYVPLMMSASKIADELSVAAITRGIENPKPRSCLQKIQFSLIDVICAGCFLGVLVMSIING